MVGLDEVTSRGPLQPQPFCDPVIFQAALSGYRYLKFVENTTGQQF